LGRRSRIASAILRRVDQFLVDELLDAEPWLLIYTMPVAGPRPPALDEQRLQDAVAADRLGGGPTAPAAIANDAEQ
jgi:hypothetical protein